MPNEFHERIARFRKRVYYLGPGRSTGARQRKPQITFDVISRSSNAGILWREREKERISWTKSTMENSDGTRVFSLSTAHTSGFRAPLLCPVTNTRTRAVSFLLRLFSPTDRPFDQPPLLQRAFHFQTSFRMNRRSFAVA